jgi:transcriptional regulator with XRE-family HTH domain
MSPHIGNKIHEFLKAKGMTVAEFSRRIKYSRENAYSIFKRESIDTQLLTTISEVLNHDFFQYYQNDDYVVYPGIKNAYMGETEVSEDIELEFKITIKNPQRRTQFLRQILGEDQMKLLIDSVNK